ncbi:dihydrodipicolinate synthase family protein [Roseomonas eburnea]|uniref:Dihydrodipicolinate synthase family protein n=1 Tax=Neoroseomonas eburnea TaxID=1346889 RepID=A0A9X9XE30_9PROT|nr:dihydrodipicolinate synthase family protein [Neoroseomonas eburnea]MBR0681966.1 dihydrodipicolinate synthase family protein [Neoroseomonas eburnea]
MTLIEALSGISGILVTPFDAHDQILPARLGPIIARCVGAGVDALTVNGNTSEFYGLTVTEAERMQAEVPALVAGRARIIAGIGRSVTEAVRLAARAKADGADAVMIHQPPDPFASPRGVADYVRRVAEAAALPVVLYLRNAAIGPDAVAALCGLPGVVAVKWANPDLMALARAIRAAPHIRFVCGLAEPWAPPMTALGAQGFTSGLINLAPERSVAILTALRAGDMPRANALIAEIGAFEALRAEEQNGANVSVVKAALALIGEDVGHARPPASWPLAPDSLARLRELVAGWRAG